MLEVWRYGLSALENDPLTQTISSKFCDKCDAGGPSNQTPNASIFWKPKNNKHKMLVYSHLLPIMKGDFSEKILPITADSA